jgi:hypothetical protein
MRTLLLSTLTLALVSLSACSSEGKFCDKMRSLYGDDMKDCETDALPEVKAQCKEPEKVFECVADAKDKEAADKCWKEKCEKK